MLYAEINVRRIMRPYFIILSVAPLFSSSKSIAYDYYLALSILMLYVTISDSSIMIQHWTRPISILVIGRNKTKRITYSQVEQKNIV